MRVLGAGQNWMDIAGLLAVGMAGYYTKLPAGSTVAAVSGNPGEFCLAAPRLVAEGKYHLAITTPLWYVTAAIEGRAPFTEPLPLNVVGVFPHNDRLMFAVRKETGLTSLHQIREQRYPLRVSMPTPEMQHPAAWVVTEILKQYGITMEDIVDWGGEILADRPKHLNSPSAIPVDPRFDAVFDEAMMTRRWKKITDEYDMVFLPVDEDVLEACVAQGMERGVIPAGYYRGLNDDVPTIDFSGWAMIARTDLPEDIAYLAAEALVERADSITERFEGPHGAMTSPLSVAELTATSLPIHPGAQKYYQQSLRRETR